jgi:hypothetical protein
MSEEEPESQQLTTKHKPTKSPLTILAALKPMREKFPRIPDPPADPVDLVALSETK